MPQIQSILAALPQEPRDHHRQQLQQAAPEARIVFKNREDVTPQDLADVELVFGNLRRRLLAQAPVLKWVQLTSAGADPYNKPGALPEGVLLTNATGVFGPIIAEHMLGILLMLMRNLHLYRDNQRQGLWEGVGPFSMLHSATVVSVGLGDLGGEFSKRVHALGARVIGVRRSAGQKPDYVDEICLSQDLDTVLPAADVVALSLPSTGQTSRMFDAQRIGRMKPGAYLLNMGRGDAVDTNALAEALQSGHLAGVGVDVTDPEPLPPEHPLWRCPNAVITPHISGGWSYQVYTLDRIVDVAVDNICRYQAGEPLHNEVDLTTGYRKA